MDEEWQVPAPAHDPEARKARVVRDAEGGARLVPGRNVVEGEFIEGESAEGGASRPTGGCPFSQ